MTLKHFWTVKGPHPDSNQWDVSCCCGYAETFDSISDVNDGWYLGSCTAPQEAVTIVRRDDLKHLLDVYVENGMVETEDADIIERLYAQLATSGRVSPDA